MSTLLRDSGGILYGTAAYGGSEQAGTVFQLVPSGATWTFKLIYTFTGQEDGGYPTVGLVMDTAEISTATTQSAERTMAEPYSS
jgi:uncharacterized repeat protein (TIGR03803 family)